MIRAVTDTGPLLHLAEAQLLHLLGLFDEVSAPLEVEAEMTAIYPDWDENRPTWLSVRSLVPPYDRDAVLWRQAGLLHAGEAAAIALARQTDPDWLLTDDAAARLFARSIGIEVHGSLGVVLHAAANGHLNRVEADAALDALGRSSLWVSARVLAEATRALDRLIP